MIAFPPDFTRRVVRGERPAQLVSADATDPAAAGDAIAALAALPTQALANLGVGFTFSTLARNQLQAMQMAFFFFLPSILLSGFMFPFRGMPGWAQTIGEVLPMTHFLRIVRGIMLEGNGWAETAPELWPMAAFLIGAGTLALARYRQTLD